MMIMTMHEQLQLVYPLWPPVRLLLAYASPPYRHGFFFGTVRYGPNKQMELERILAKRAESFFIKPDQPTSILDVYPCVPIR